jgi:hypothetical protein
MNEEHYIKGFRQGLKFAKSLLISNEKDDVIQMLSEELNNGELNDI